MKKIVLILFFVLTANTTDKFNCDKRYCKEMKSCEEAYHYLRKCGRSGFDRDGDGIPCENVCKGRRVKR
ncbi:excalibur calcium-binding domain-containing protein [Campylobacter concisus]|uniref:excalibur calcium-binding domain-containing protein n=1 Tax=Campylobacter concisus TaxID=199 RepID=UPI000CD8B1A6|nr:excalibur calcium-binding domain-containing protein [Campylobacter concisus]MCA6130659.1 excalibur calcium-binding domain-containing protein [Campylobacter concisus]MCA6132135.1 excalibur calcium-binding domain-containing protein [Campylobacter concisus]